jgi:hypothetical protein
MRTFDHALIAGGAGLALLTGMITAELGLAPLHQVVEAQAALSRDTMPAAAPEAIQADLSSPSQGSPPPVMVPVSNPTPPQPAVDATDDPAPRADDGAQRSDDGDAPADGGRQEALELDPSTDAGAGSRNAEQDRDPATPAQDPSSQDTPSVAPS